jgi:hypothetical protein
MGTRAPRRARLATASFQHGASSTRRPSYLLLFHYHYEIVGHFPWSLPVILYHFRVLRGLVRNHYDGSRVRRQSPLCCYLLSASQTRGYHRTDGGRDEGIGGARYLFTER